MLKHEFFLCLFHYGYLSLLVPCGWISDLLQGFNAHLVQLGLLLFLRCCIYELVLNRRSCHISTQYFFSRKAVAPQDSHLKFSPALLHGIFKLGDLSDIEPETFLYAKPVFSWAVMSSKWVCWCLDLFPLLLLPRHLLQTGAVQDITIISERQLVKGISHIVAVTQGQAKQVRP